MNEWHLTLNRNGGCVKRLLLHGLAEERAESIMSFNWKRLLGCSQDDVLGLDIGSSSVRMIQLAKNGDGYTVVAAHVCDIKQDNADVAAREESIVQPASHCPNCQKPILWQDNIPLLSYLLLRGKCRSCGMKISFRYFSVELLTGLLFLALYHRPNTLRT